MAKKFPKYTAETPTAFRKRLLKEKKWSEFVAVRDQFEYEEGHGKTDANQMARWEFPLTDFTSSAGVAADAVKAVPLPEPEPEPDDDGFISADIFAGREPVSPRKQVEWIYQHLTVSGIKPGQAPDAGTWARFQFIRSDTEATREFYKVYDKLLPTKAEIEAGEKFRDDGREQFDLLDQLAAERRKLVPSPA